MEVCYGRKLHFRNCIDDEGRTDPTGFVYFHDKTGGGPTESDSKHAATECAAVSAANIQQPQQFQFLDFRMIRALPGL